MSASSGIGVAPDLISSFAQANSLDNVRFIKISIANELLIQDLSIPKDGSFYNDLALLQNLGVLQDNVPAYILAKKAPSDWLAISYVPESARVRDKMLYASTRGSLLKAIGSSFFTDTIFATSREDLTSEAYVAHKRHVAAPKPLSARELEMANVRAAESGGAYEGSRARTSHVGTGIGLLWSRDAETAIKQLGEGEGNTLVVLGIDVQTETLIIKSTSETSVEYLGSTLPPSDPCYAFFGWLHTHDSLPKREILFIYSCPSSSPIKDRMIYSSGVSSTYLTGKNLLLALPIPIHIASRKIETSSPEELSETFLRDELGFGDLSETNPTLGSNIGTLVEGVEKKLFAKPRGPGRRRL